MLKAQLVARAGDFEQAVELLLHIPGARDGGETTTLLILYMLKAAKNEAAIELGRSVFSQDPTKFAFLSHVASSLTEAGRAAEAFPILIEIRDAMIEAGEQDKYGDLLGSAWTGLPIRWNPCRHSRISIAEPAIRSVCPTPCRGWPTLRSPTARSRSLTMFSPKWWREIRTMKSC